MSKFSFRFRCFSLLVAAPLFVCGLAAATAAHAQVGSRSAALAPSSPLHIEGTVIKTFFLQSEAVVKVTSVTPLHGEATALNPPRVKLIKFRDAELPDNLFAGISFTADGNDAGRGRPLRVARITIAGVETVFSESEFGTDASDATSADPSGAPNAVPTGDTGSPGTPALWASPDPHVVDSLERGMYECWSHKRDDWGAALNSAQSSSATSKTPLVGADAAPRAFVLLQDGTRVEGSRLLTLEATGYGPTDNGDWGDQTALSTTVGFGTVAVDPRVIPLGKHLWVEGYGFCIALDTGGAIKGMRIDLGQDSEEEAEAVGRQKRRVLVLD